MDVNQQMIDGLNTAALEVDAAVHNELQRKYDVLQKRYDEMANRLTEMESDKTTNKDTEVLEESNHQEISQMKKEAQSHSACITEIKKVWNFVNDNFNKLTSDSNDMQQYMRLRTLLVHGLKNVPAHLKGIAFSEYVLGELQKLFPQHAKYLVPGSISVSHPMPTKSKTKSLVIVKFVQRDVRNLLFYDKKTLKGNKDKIVITEHLTSRNLDLLNQSRDLFGYNNAWSSACKIFVLIGGKKYHVRNLNDLCYLQQNNSHYSAPDSAEHLLNSKESSTLMPNASHSNVPPVIGNSDVKRDRFGNKRLSRPFANPDSLTSST